MTFHQMKVVISTVVPALFLATPLWAQLQTGAGSAAKTATDGKLQAQTQQRVQSQIQQRAQAQVQQQIQVQAQARLQAEAARAAQVAREVAAAAQRQAATARQAANANVRVNADARIRANAQGGNQSANVAGQAAARTEAHVDLGNGLPPGITQADLQLYDNIFGPFNPFRQPGSPSSEQPTAEPANQPSTQAAQQPENPARDQPSGNSPPQASGGRPPVNNPPAQTQPEPAPQNPPSQRDTLGGRLLTAGAGSVQVSPHVDWTSRIQLAARERRAQISQLRDRALATGQVQLLQQAEQMETVLNAFVEAQARQEAAARSGVGQAPHNPRSTNASGDLNGGGSLQGAGRLGTTRRSAPASTEAKGESTQQPSGTVR